MRELAMQQYGCIEFLSFTEGDQEISISYWETQEHIRQWKQNAEHFKAQALGKSMWYHAYQIEVVEIIRKYTHPGGKP
jgi:heme-degrading monooxygenase HmoA